jgi:hypothetical protein
MDRQSVWFERDLQGYLGFVAYVLSGHCFEIGSARICARDLFVIFTTTDFAPHMHADRFARWFCLEIDGRPVFAEHERLGRDSPEYRARADLEVAILHLDRGLGVIPLTAIQSGIRLQDCRINSNRSLGRMLRQDVGEINVGDRAP